MNSASLRPCSAARTRRQLVAFSFLPFSLRGNIQNRGKGKKPALPRAERERKHNMEANECTCTATTGPRLCPACEAAYIKWNLEEVYGQQIAEYRRNLAPQINKTISPRQVAALMALIERKTAA
jgi:putative heme iron utilization protein